jgi:hypothetical protein
MGFSYLGTWVLVICVGIGVAGCVVVIRQTLNLESRARKSENLKLERRSRSLFQAQNGKSSLLSPPWSSLQPPSPSASPSQPNFGVFSVPAGMALEIEGKTVYYNGSPHVVQIALKTPIYQGKKVDFSTMAQQHLGQSRPWGNFPAMDPWTGKLAVPDVIAKPILSYRAFSLTYRDRSWDVLGRLVANELELWSVNAGFGRWLPGTNKAEHHGSRLYGYDGSLVPGITTPHICPQPGEDCGFWSLHDLEHASRKLTWPSDNKYFPVTGLIQGWGRVQQHTGGYRFQYASVVALALGFANSQITAVAQDFAASCVQQICRTFDCAYVDDWKKLKEVKDAEEAKSPQA